MIPKLKYDIFNPAHINEATSNTYHLELGNPYWRSQLVGSFNSSTTLLPVDEAGVSSTSLMDVQAIISLRLENEVWMISQVGAEQKKCYINRRSRSIVSHFT